MHLIPPTKNQREPESKKPENAISQKSENSPEPKKQALPRSKNPKLTSLKNRKNMPVHIKTPGLNSLISQKAIFNKHTNNQETQESQKAKIVQLDLSKLPSKNPLKTVLKLSHESRPIPKSFLKPKFESSIKKNSLSMERNFENERNYPVIKLSGDIYSTYIPPINKVNSEFAFQHKFVETVSSNSEQLLSSSLTFQRLKKQHDQLGSSQLIKTNSEFVTLVVDEVQQNLQKVMLNLKNLDSTLNSKDRSQSRQNRSQSLNKIFEKQRLQKKTTPPPQFLEKIVFSNRDLFQAAFEKIEEDALEVLPQDSSFKINDFSERQIRRPSPTGITAKLENGHGLVMHRVASNPHTKIDQKTTEKLKQIQNKKQTKNQNSDLKHFRFFQREKHETEHKSKNFLSVGPKLGRQNPQELELGRDKKKHLDRPTLCAWNLNPESRKNPQNEQKFSLLKRDRKKSHEKLLDNIGELSVEHQVRSFRRLRLDSKPSVSPKIKRTHLEHSIHLDPKLKLLNLTKKTFNLKTNNREKDKILSNSMKSVARKEQNIGFRKEFPTVFEKRIVGGPDEGERKATGICYKNLKFKSAKQVFNVDKNKSDIADWKNSVFGTVYYKKLFPNAAKICTLT